MNDYARHCMQDIVFVIIRGRFVWLIGLSGLMVGGAMLIFYKPGLRLPEHNPLQVFKDTHIYEWYDNHAEQLFAFVESKYQVQMVLRIVWGFYPVDDGGLFDPTDMGNLRIDFSFHMNKTSDIHQLADAVRRLRVQSFFANSTDSHYRYWPERFLQW